VVLVTAASIRLLRDHLLDLSPVMLASTERDDSILCHHSNTVFTAKILAVVVWHLWCLIIFMMVTSAVRDLAIVLPIADAMLAPTSLQWSLGSRISSSGERAGRITSSNKPLS